MTDEKTFVGVQVKLARIRWDQLVVLAQLAETLETGRDLAAAQAAIPLAPSHWTDRLTVLDARLDALYRQQADCLFDYTRIPQAIRTAAETSVAQQTREDWVDITTFDDAARGVCVTVNGAGLDRPQEPYE